MSNKFIIKEWNMNFRNQEATASWTFDYSKDQLVIQIVKDVIKKLGLYLRPISLHFHVRMSDNPKDPDYVKSFIFNTSKYFNENDIIMLENRILKFAQSLDETRIKLCFIYCAAYLTYFKHDELISEWYPPMDYYKDEPVEDNADDFFDGIFRIDVSRERLVFQVYTDIWIPQFRDDILATKNGENLTSILRSIEQIVSPIQIRYEPEAPDMYKYGYKSPEEYFSD